MSWLSSVAGAALGIWSGNKSANAQSALAHEQMQWQSQEAQKIEIGKKNVFYCPSARD